MQNTEKLEFLNGIDRRLAEIETRKGQVFEEIQVREAEMRALVEEQQALITVRNFQQNRTHPSAPDAERLTDDEVGDQLGAIDNSQLLQLRLSEGTPVGVFGAGATLGAYGAGAKVWKSVVVDALRAAGKPMHYGELADHLRRHGLPFGVRTQPPPSSPRWRETRSFKGLAGVSTGLWTFPFPPGLRRPQFVRGADARPWSDAPPNPSRERRRSVPGSGGEGWNACCTG